MAMYVSSTWLILYNGNQTNRMVHVSFEWTDCSMLYDTSLVGGRCATTAYVLIFSASACMLRDGMQPKRLIYGVWPTKLSNTAVFWIMHVLIPFAFFFSAATSMWFFLKD
jgi:hypothetical protein